jgi:vancomycin permeability regulator SanA
MAAFDRTFSKSDAVPKNAVGLVLGTSAKTSD